MNAIGVPGAAMNGAVGELTASTVCPRQAISIRSDEAFTTVPRTTLRSPMSRATLSDAGRPPPGPATDCGAPEARGPARGRGTPEALAFGARLHHPPVFVEDQPVAELVGLGEIVGDQHHRPAEPHDQAPQLAAELSP